MDSNEQSNLDFRVLRGQDNQWHVTADDFHQPLASFDSPHDACAWAIARAKPKQCRVFVEETFVDYSRSTNAFYTPARIRSSTAGSMGLTRQASNPACRARRKSSSWP